MSGVASVFLLVFSSILPSSSSYSVSISLHDSETHLGKNYEWRDRALVFSVINVERTHFVGMAWLPPQIEVLRD